MNDAASTAQLFVSHVIEKCESALSFHHNNLDVKLNRVIDALDFFTKAVTQAISQQGHEMSTLTDEFNASLERMMLVFQAGKTEATNASNLAAENEQLKANLASVVAERDEANAALSDAKSKLDALAT